MRKLASGLGAVALLFGAAASAEEMTVAGHRIDVAEDGMGGAALVVDGAVMHENGVILLDAAPQVLDGVTVLTGAAGAGGNACNAAPFVLALPEGAAPEFWGPVDSCAYFTPAAEGGRLVFTSDAVPGAAGESWIWTPDAGFAPGPAKGFAASKGWDAFDSLAGAHPVEALAIAPVLKALQAGLGADYPAFAERISELGSGDLTAEGYQGGACLKFSCDTDWAVLYLHRASKGVYAIWHVAGEVEPKVWPTDTTAWPPEALAALGEAVEE
jgi:hypothetical protein